MNQYVGKRCPYCNSVFKEDDHIVVCSICDMPHHLECWQDNQGCSTFGCTGVIKEVIGKPVSTEQSAERANVQSSVASKPESHQPAAPQKTNKRFEEIKRFEDKLLFPEAHIVLLGYTIIKDNNSKGDLFIRFQFSQYSDKVLMAVLADLVCYDPWGNETERVDGVQFLDLHANRSTEFGQTVPVKLSNQNARNVCITIKSLIYSDGSRLIISEEGESFNSPKRLTEHIKNDDLLAQYKRETSNKATTLPMEQKTLRTCCCGAFYDASLSVCPACKTNFDSSVGLLKEDLLKEKLVAFQAAEAEKTRIKKEREEETQRRLEEAQRLSEERTRKELEEKEKAEAEEKAKKKRKVKRIITIAVATLAAVGLTVASILYFIPLLRYTIAKSNLEKSNYDKAIATFAALGDFNDSAEMTKEAKYQKALSLMDAQQFAEAKTVFDEIKGYKESNSKATVCDRENTYLLALKDFENKKYEDAAKKFDSIKANKTEAKEYAEKSHYLFAKELFDKKNYKDAAVHFSSAGSYEDASEKLKEAQYLYGLECFAKKDYKTAYDYLTKVKTYKDVPEKYNDVCYQYGLKLLSDKEWKNAVDIFSKLGSFSESATKLNEAKYGYCLAHKNRTDSTTYSYLKDLRASGYKDSKSIYSNLYAWKATIVINNSETNESSSRSSVSRYDTIYCHIKLSGGPPNGKTKLSYSGSWPDGDRFSESWDGEWGDGYSGSCYFWYNTPAYGRTGTFTVSIYDGDGNRIGSDTIQIVN